MSGNPCFSYRLLNNRAGPEAVYWNGGGRLDLPAGAESGQVYLFERTYIDRGCRP